MSEIKVDTLTGKTTANDITVTVGATATQSLHDGILKAHVAAYHSSGTPTINGSLNISSITDTGVGKMTPYFSNNMNDALYTGTMGAWAYSTWAAVSNGIGGYVTNGFSLNHAEGTSGTFTDASGLTVPLNGMIAGDLA